MYCCNTVVFMKKQTEKLKALVYALKREGMGLSLDALCRKKLISDTGPCLEGWLKDLSCKHLDTSSVSVGFLTCLKQCLKQSKCVMFEECHFADVWHSKSTKYLLLPWTTWGLSKRCHIPIHRRIQENLNPTARWTVSKEGQGNRPVIEMLRIHIFCSPGSEPATWVSFSLKSLCQYTVVFRKHSSVHWKSLQFPNIVFKKIL